MLAVVYSNSRVSDSLCTVLLRLVLNCSALLGLRSIKWTWQNRLVLRFPERKLRHNVVKCSTARNLESFNSPLR
jgi:hypothetical protein